MKTTPALWTALVGVILLTQQVAGLLYSRPLTTPIVLQNEINAFGMVSRERVIGFSQNTLVYHTKDPDVPGE